jgi:hypothetical protein
MLMDIFAIPKREIEKRHRRIIKRNFTYKGLLRTVQRECDSFPWDSRMWLAVLHRVPEPGEDCKIEIRVYAATDTAEDTERYQNAMSYTGRLPGVVVHRRVIGGSLKDVMNDALATVRLVKSMAETLTVLESTK